MWIHQRDFGIIIFLVKEGLHSIGANMENAYTHSYYEIIIRQIMNKTFFLFYFCLFYYFLTI